MMNKRIKKHLSEIDRKFAKNAVRQVEADGTFEGYASIFDAVDLSNDKVAKGASSKSIRDKTASGIRMLFQHNPDEPIGHWLSIKEDASGLHVKGQLNLDVARGREVHALMRSGDIDGLSIGFKTARARREKGGTVRRILEADLWEISVVKFPMLPEARITGVKAAAFLPSKPEFERRLIHDLGLSQSQAKIVIAKGYNHLLTGRPTSQLNSKSGHHIMQQLADKIRRAAHQIQPH